MTRTIAINIPDAIAQHYPSPDALQRDLYEDIVIRAYQKGFLTIREGAQLLDLSYEGFVELLGSLGLSFINASSNELSQSYRQFESFMQSYSAS